MAEKVFGGLLILTALGVIVCVFGWRIESHRERRRTAQAALTPDALPKREPLPDLLPIYESSGHQWYRDRLDLTAAQRNKQIDDLNAAYYQPPVTPGRSDV